MSRASPSHGKSRRPSKSGIFEEEKGALAHYNVHDDVDKLTKFFDAKWGSLENAKNAQGWFDLDQEYDIVQFEALLRSWGVKVDSVTNLFDQIDMDYSGKVSVQELFAEIERPLQELHEREQQRKINEVNRIYDTFADAIQGKHGSIENAFVAFSAGGGVEQELSMAQFMKLAQDLQIALAPAQLRRAFGEIDRDRGGNISLDELKAALESHLNRKNLVAIAGFLADTERFPDSASITQLIQDAMGDLQAAHPASGQFGTLELASARSSSSPTGAAGGPEVGRQLSNLSLSGEKSQETPQDMDKHEQRVIRALRKLRVVPDAIQEGPCKSLLKALRTDGQFKIDDFMHRLRDEHERSKLEEKRKKQDAEHKSKEVHRALKQAVRTDDRRRTEEEVDRWAERAQAKQGGPKGRVKPEEVTRSCIDEARAAMARTQLKDYVERLERHLENRQQVRDSLQKELWDEEGLSGDFFNLQTPVQGGHAARSRRRSMSASGDSLWDTRPPTPDTPHVGLLPTPSAASQGSMTPYPRSTSSSLPRESKAQRAEQLVQAAATGDITALQRCLERQADPNAVGWAGVTPLMAAAHHGREVVLDFLICSRSDVLRTDVRGRTALDHAYRRPRAQERLRAHQGMTGRELEMRARDLARRVLLVEEERARLEEQRSKLPSKEVRERMQQQSRFTPLSVPAQSPPASPSSDTRRRVSFQRANSQDVFASPPLISPLGNPLARMASAPIADMARGSPPHRSPSPQDSGTLHSVLLSRRPPGECTPGRKDKQTRIQLPLDARGS